jgi:DNA-directed RNA polymerase subunit RPC12/RpoP
MIVQAKCTFYVPGGEGFGPYYPGVVYSIEHDGPLAALKLHSTYVFKFDRTMQGTGLEPAVGGYKCKLCSKVFDKLEQLGNHHYSSHPKQYITEEIDESEPIVVERRGRKSGQEYRCAKCGKELPHLYAMRLHKNECPAPAMEVAS